MSQQLAGVQVVDLTMVCTGQVGTGQLGVYGAEVIEVERPRLWDLLRALDIIPRDVPHLHNRSAWFNHNDRNESAVSY